MASKTFKKTTELIIPGGFLFKDFIDGIYIDGRFFEENIPILGATLFLKVKPIKDITTQLASCYLRTFQNGILETHKYDFYWGPFQDGVWERVIDFGSAFFGAGLNLFYWLCTRLDLTAKTPIFTVNYELRVKY